MTKTTATRPTPADDYDRELPFFVYGTLREGFGNHRLLRAVDAQGVPALLQSYAMYDAGVPFIRGLEDSTVYGELYTVSPERYAEARRHLDMLEGFRPGEERSSLYRRLAVTVVAEGRRVRAWVYIGGGYFRTGTSPRVASGDWAVHRRAA